MGRVKTNNNVGVIRKKKKKSARLNANSYFLTWPRNNADKTDVMNKILEYWQNKISWAVVCHEHHNDGGNHLHAIIHFVIKKDTTHSKLKKITGKHGDYQGARQPLAVLKYIIKDKDYVEYNIDAMEKALEYQKKQRNIGVKITELIKEGCNFRQIEDQEPGYCLSNANKVENRINRQIMYNAQDKRPTPPFQFVVKSVDINHEKNVINARKIEIWLNNNIGKVRNLKQKQLYLYGEKDLGKTQIKRDLKAFGFLHYKFPHEFFFDLYQDGYYDYIFIEEFGGYIPKIQFMNELLEGDELTLRVKGGQRMKNDNLPVIICGQLAIEKYYPNTHAHIIAALRTRLEEVQIYGWMNYTINKI